MEWEWIWLENQLESREGTLLRIQANASGYMKALGETPTQSDERALMVS